MIKDICNALIEADVNIKLISGLRKSIRNTVNFKDLAPGVNKKKIIQKVIESTPR
jgi:signal recognition particle subunit SRP54